MVIQAYCKNFVRVQQQVETIGWVVEVRSALRPAINFIAVIGPPARRQPLCLQEAWTERLGCILMYHARGFSDGND